MPMTEDEAFDAFSAGWGERLNEDDLGLEDCFEHWWNDYRPEPPDILK